MRLRRAARRATWTGLLVALVAGVTALPPTTSGSAATTTGQSYPVPAGRTFTLHGHGYGHGHGMSQYGAYGAARQGLGYRRIVDFYYPGTSWGTVTGRVRVLVTGDTTTDLVVSPADGLELYDAGSGARYPLPDLAGVTRWRLDVSGTRTVVDYLTSSWHRFRPGGRAALVGDGQLKASGPLTLWTPSGSRSYRGSLRAASPSAGSRDRDTVNVVPVDAYVQGVVQSEMPTSWPIEAVKTQAVAARTYATWSRDQRKDRAWQVCDTSACQVYRGVAAETARGNTAVRATAHQVLTHGGTAAFTQFSSSSGGWTAAGSRPYLVAGVDPYDDHPANPVHDWSLRLRAATIEHAYPGIGRLVRLRVVRRDGHGQWGGRVQSLVLDGRRKDVTISGDTFRSRFGLRSTWFAG
jgi:stage II sporulation protein D